MNAHATKSALHRTRLRFLDHKDFSVLFFYKTQRQPAPPLGFCRRTPTENSERNFSVFQFFGSRKDRHEILTIRNKRILCGFSQFEWISECE
jgi:cytidine deaminase